MRKLVGSRWYMVGGEWEDGRWKMEGGYWNGVKAASRRRSGLDLKRSDCIFTGQITKQLRRDLQR